MIFILDNFDSFTYNLYQYFGELGEEVSVRRANECQLSDIIALDPELIVISPGPCTPTEAQLSLQVISELKGKYPILGVCLGHQAIGQAFGGKVVRAGIPIHGKTSLIKHDGAGVFQGLPLPLEVTRYHSLILERESLPPELIITATTEQGEIMGVRHHSLPLEGVQFHPEAILTAEGHTLLHNAVVNARKWLASKHADPWQVKALTCELTPELLFPALRTAPAPFFLDSGVNYGNLGRYSFMGAFPLLQATATRHQLELHWPESGRHEIHSLADRRSLDWLDELLAKYQVPNSTSFPFAGGAVGYFSYDLKDELEVLPSWAQDDLGLPLWRLAWYDGIIIFDHREHRYWLTACGMRENGSISADLAAFRLQRLEGLLNNYLRSETGTAASVFEARPDSSPQAITPSVPRDQYLKDLNRVIDYIYAGDIYQANLTQRFTVPLRQEPWELYLQLHKHNPAPFAAYIPYPDFQILSSSPERFISINSDGVIETRPIKGTRPRGIEPGQDRALADELLSSTKDRAELTMIVDLERNDLGRLAEFGSVEVSDLIRLEKYPTVWHLVSTIKAQLRQGITASEILGAIFPGGSITGAPKIRAMEIIEELEPYKRGIYTGSIGYLGFDGAWDLNIVIRTIILKDGYAYLNAGGGIVADSIPETEYQETLHKAQALFTVLGGILQEQNSR